MGQKTNHRLPSSQIYVNHGKLNSNFRENLDWKPNEQIFHDSGPAMISISATMAVAGGVTEPVEEEVVEKTNRSGALLPLLLLVAVAAAATSASNTNSNENANDENGGNDDNNGGSNGDE